MVCEELEHLVEVESWDIDVDKACGEDMAERGGLLVPRSVFLFFFFMIILTSTGYILQASY